uniref:Retrovirus-related Pol polyprotein from transposon TNT 1-94-like beta-barrel domain-containing protein n=1 Tax=Nicotiana tabacum TaxID=4097 RepID=A0A1S4BS89_TOBAC
MSKAWKHSDFLCKNYILSGLEDDLCNVYSNAETSKELWDALEKKYKTEDGGSKKFVAAKFLDYKMVDSKPVITQVQELQVIIHDLLTEGLVINEALQVAAMIEKLPLLWRDFKNYSKHMRKEIKLEDLIVRLRIKEENKAAEKKTCGNSTIMGANIVETVPTNPKKGRSLLDQTTILARRNSRETATTVEREAFASYAPAGPDETTFMGNFATTKIESYGKIFLKMMSGKVVTLNNICHVPEIRKNLVSISLLVKNKFK